VRGPRRPWSDALRVRRVWCGAAQMARLAEQDSGGGRNKMRQLARELANMQPGGKLALPVLAAAAVFVRTDALRPDKMRAVLTGPQASHAREGLGVACRACRAWAWLAGAAQCRGLGGRGAGGRGERVVWSGVLVRLRALATTRAQPRPRPARAAARVSCACHVRVRVCACRARRTRAGCSCSTSSAPRATPPTHPSWPSTTRVRLQATRAATGAAQRWA
jgi:hypothetical protein